MNPYLISILTGSFTNRTRKCIKCGKVQIVSVKNKKSSAQCKFCGAIMPGKK